ncbi:MAG: tRNA (adenosine(37)-N6)-threonylcarbamoyltransferase complex ATPase subunit type 1 TsaE, partial [Leptospira sp.]|nr:tRNA (adenosine(37)-N6)-threonylcarbamoyltransferase complex ATPase subunit type 1 TsaE [Leptospira sp.]
MELTGKFFCTEEKLEAPVNFCKELLRTGNVQYPIFLLNGEMGSGKTTFVSSFVKSISPSVTVNSPTYTLMNEYRSKEHLFYHFDLYRILEERELENLGFEEIWGKRGICFIEWWKVAEKYFHDKNSISIELEHISL